MSYDKTTDGYVLLDWLDDNCAHLERSDEHGWRVVCAVNGAILGHGAKPSSAIISAANNKRSNTEVKPSHEVASA